MTNTDQQKPDIAEVRTKVAESFDTSTVFIALYLWLIFGFLSPTINCDLQRIMVNNAYFRNLFGVISVYFLFAIFEKNKSTHIGYVFAKSFIVYVMFLLATKSKWYFIMTVLALLLIDQIIKNHIMYLQTTNPDKDITNYQKARAGLLYATVGVIVVGSFDYLLKQRKDYGKDFSWTTFLLGTNKCNMQK